MMFNRGSKESFRPFPNSQFFKPKEFMCVCGICQSQLVDANLIDALHQLRVIIDKPIVINSGFRCERYQHQLFLTMNGDAADHSFHCKGMAADVVVTGMDPIDVAIKANLMFNGIGVAPHGFCHLDIRPDKQATWTYGGLDLAKVKADLGRK